MGDLPSSREADPPSRSGHNGLSLSLSLAFFSAQEKRTAFIIKCKGNEVLLGARLNFTNFFDTRREFGDRRWRWGAHDCRVYDR